MWDFDKSCIKSVYHLGRIAIFAVLHLPIHKQQFLHFVNIH